MKPTKGTIIRTAVLVLAFINAGLALFGKEKLPITEDMVYQCVSFLVLLVSGFTAWWKNNSFTEEALRADVLMKQLKSDKK